MKYKVVHPFKDLQDENRLYAVGDEYKGKKSKERIKELTTEKNRIGRPLIKVIEENEDETMKDTESGPHSTDTEN